MLKKIKISLLLIFLLGGLLQAQPVKKIYLFFTNDLHARIGRQKPAF